MSKGRRISKRSTRRYQRDFRSSLSYRAVYATKVLPVALKTAINNAVKALNEFTRQYLSGK